nr:MAG TPA: hypothetical protein [Caudoviricetes sp.]
MLPAFRQKLGSFIFYNIKKVQTPPINKGESTIKRRFLFMAV